MFDIAHIPPELQPAAKLLEEQIKETQKNCTHVFGNIMGRDPFYSPRIHRGMGDWKVIKEQRCPLCNLSKVFNEVPYRVCHQCGGAMKIDHTEQCAGERVTIHKCEVCGHEYDTT